MNVVSEAAYPGGEGSEFLDVINTSFLDVIIRGDKGGVSVGAKLEVIIRSDNYYYLSGDPLTTCPTPDLIVV